MQMVATNEMEESWMDEGFTSYYEGRIMDKYYGEKESSFSLWGISAGNTETTRLNYTSMNNLSVANTKTLAYKAERNGYRTLVYDKTAVWLETLEGLLGIETMDKIMQTYFERWKFKHPTPEDFFRTMEDASAVDLDWYWRGWFYTTDYVDIGVKDIKKYYVTNKPTKKMEEYMAARNLTVDDLPPLVYLAEEGSEDFDPSMKGKAPSESSQTLKEFMMDNMTEAERTKVKEPKYFYEVTYDKPGGIPMPLIVEYTYADGSKENITYPPEIWRKNDKEVSVVLSSEKELTGVIVDPKAETADIDTTNNGWPRKEEKSDFDKMKEKIKG